MTSPENSTPAQKAPLWVLALATVGGLGYAPVASGTVGSLGAVLVFLLMSRLWGPLYLLVWIGLFLLACETAQRVRLALDKDDPGIVVIDELVGFLLTMFMVPCTWQYILAGFLLFRLFDIVKPFPANYFDQKVMSGFGVVMDDVIAGFYAFLLLQLYRLIWG